MALKRFCEDPHETLEFIHCYSCYNNFNNTPSNSGDIADAGVSEEVGEFATIDLEESSKPQGSNSKASSPKLKRQWARVPKHSFLRQALNYQTLKSCDKMLELREAKDEAIRKAESEREGQ